MLKNFYNSQASQSYISYLHPKEEEDIFSHSKPDTQRALSSYDYNSHFYPNSKADMEQGNSWLVNVETLTRNINKPNYFFGDAMGILRKFNRSMETIEASITFDEERDCHHYENLKGTGESEVQDIYIISSLGIIPNSPFQIN